MTNITSILAYLAVVVSGLSSGAMLTGAAVLVPFWRSIAATEFLAWFVANADRMEFYFGPLQAGTIILTVAGVILFGIGHRAGTALLATAAVLAVAVLATFPMYFRSANASFVAASIPVGEVPAELARWALWQWVRTVLGVLAFIFSMLAVARPDASVAA
jgi:hypothetical protein